MIEQDTSINRAEAPIPVAPPTQSQIVVSGEGEKLPKWFYLLFVIVFILFVAMTMLLVNTLGK